MDLNELPLVLKQHVSPADSDLSFRIFRPEMCDGVTLKMLPLRGRGGAGRDGDAVLAGGGCLGTDGSLTAVLTDLECKGENYNHTSAIKIIQYGSNYKVMNEL